jgi:hypothetical protein
MRFAGFLPDFIAFWGEKWYFKPYLKTKTKFFVWENSRASEHSLLIDRAGHSPR